ncbi:hypothetical protein OGATHE_000001, partial [Ogataea polymorpha]
LFIDRGDALELPAFTLPKAVKNTDTPEDEDDEDDFALEGEVIDLDGPKRKAEDEKEPAAKKRKLDASAEIEIVEL